MRWDWQQQGQGKLGLLVFPWKQTKEAPDPPHFNTGQEPQPTSLGQPIQRPKERFCQLWQEKLQECNFTVLEASQMTGILPQCSLVYMALTAEREIWGGD